MLDYIGINKVDNFVFLGSMILGTSRDVKGRTALARIGNLKKNVWSRKDVSRKLKMRLYYAVILPIAIYDSETWALTKQDCPFFKYLRTTV